MPARTQEPQGDSSEQVLDSEVVHLGSLALSRYFAAALMMPYEDFLGRARDTRYDIQRLQAFFGRNFPQIAYRLTTLQRPGAEGIPLHGLEVDIAGNVLWHFSNSGLQIPRYAALCPKWNLYEAFLTPGRINVQLGTLPAGQSFLNIACAYKDRPASHERLPRYRSFMLGCDASMADNLVYGTVWRPLQGGTVTDIGTTCRYCAHENCAHRLVARRS
jgi:predicted transcriptional regulator